MKRIYIAGLGPGAAEDITPAVINAIKDSDVVVGYKYYFQFVEPYLKPGTECIDTGMKKERERAEEAFRMAKQGKTVCVISSGDLMTPWDVIEKRIKAAAMGDFITAIYNPKSHGRYWQLHRLVEIFLKERSGETPVGYVRQAGRPEQEVHLTTLDAFDPEDVDMFTVVIIGNSQSYIRDGKFVTPRGYFRNREEEGRNVGQSIMIKSFQTIRGELKNPHIPIWRMWPMLHAIHTTADFDMENLVWMDDEATAKLYEKVKNGTLKSIVTDVTMAASGIRKGALQRLGIIGAPVGFVHVEESKHAAKPFKEIPKIIIEGRKGGSNLAATLVNSILTFDDAEQLKPGRDV